MLRPSLTEAPSLRRHYPASSVLRTSPPPHTARPDSRELLVDRYHDHRWGFPCCLWSPMRTCRHHYPGRSDGACSLVPLHRQRPSLCNSQVGSCNCFFGACSAFTHVTACTLAESPSDPFHRKLRQLRCLGCRFDCYRVERTSSRAGVAPAEVQRLSRRTVTSARHVACLRLINGVVGTPSVYRKRDSAIAERAAEEEKRPIHVMGSEVCNGRQNPKTAR